MSNLYEGSTGLIDSFCILLTGNMELCPTYKDTGLMYEYTWKSNRLGRIHIIDKTAGNNTYCGNHPYENIGENPADRPVCTMCTNYLINDRKPKQKKKRKPAKSTLRKQKQVADRKNRQDAREKLIKYFGLQKYATNMAICLCIHKKTELDMPSNDKQARKMITNYAKHVSGRANHFRYGYMPSDEFYSSKKWREVRYIALQQSGGACSLCGASAKDGVQLHVDHIVPRSRNPVLQFNLDNLQILCEDCNMGKSNYDDTDWR